MKLALIFLSVLVVFSHQQYQRPRGKLWMPPYVAQRVINNYQPIYYDDDIQDDNSFIRYFAPSKPSIYSQNGDQGVNDGMESEINIYESEFQDPQFRIKGFYRPSSFLHQQQQDPRFFFANTITNPFFKTATFTLTSTMNMTAVQSCIPSDVFKAVASQNVICRRKREILDSFDDTPEDIQFSINPSETQQLIPTALVSHSPMRGNSQLPEQTLNREITSSKDEVSFSETSPNVSKEKRFLFNNIVSTTVTTYTFLTTTVTKTVNIASDGEGLCRPVGYIVCV